jgi:hypothetical protein
VQPEDSALMHAATNTAAGGAAGLGRTSKPRQQAKHTLQLPAPPAPVVVMALGAQGTCPEAVPAAAAAVAAKQAAAQHKCSSMFDLPRSQGYTFSTARAKAAAELSRCEQPAAQQPSCNTDGMQGRDGHTQQPQGSAAGERRSNKERAAVKLQQPRAPAQQQQQQAGSARAVCSNSTLGRGATPAQHLPQPAAAAAAAAAQQQAHQRHSKYSSVLQQQDSFASQRSHGLSLRKGSRPSSPAPQAAHTAATSRQQPLIQQQPQSTHIPSCGKQQPLPQQKEPRAQQGPRLQTAEHSSLARHHSSARSGGRSVSPPPRRVLRPSAGSSARQRGGSGKPGSTAAGSVAAVAAVKAALAGFGARGWQQEVRMGLCMLQPYCDLLMSLSTDSQVCRA